MRESPVRLPALMVGLVLVSLVCAFTPYNNVKLLNSPLAGGHFPLASFACMILLLLAINPLLGVVKKSWSFHFQELLLIWCMITTASGIAYTGLMRTFIINITTPKWFTTTSGNVGDILTPLAPPSLFPADSKLIATLYSGMDGALDMSWWEILSRIPWNAWALPMLWWGLFVLLLYASFIGMVGLFSHQWIENEKMNFPLLRVLEMMGETVERGSLWKFFSQKHFIVGFSIPVILHLFNGLHTYYPEVPQIPTLILAQPYIPKEGLLSGFYKAKIYIYPAFIGFAFLASKQVSFSFWAFFIMGGFLPGLLQFIGWRLPAAALGTTFGPVLSRVEEMQMMGAFAVFFFFIVWLARDHLRMVLRGIFQKSDVAEGFHGFLGPRPAFFLFMGGIIGLIAWMNFFGMDLLPTILFLAVCFMIQLVVARLVCQGGLPYFTLALAPSDGFLAFLNTRILSPLTLYLSLVVQKVAFLDMRESLMPSLFHSSKLSNGSSPKKRFLWGIIWSILLGLIISFAAMLSLYYKYGINTLPDDWAVETARRIHENAAQLLTHPEEYKNWSMVFCTIGAVVMALLVFGYHHFIWWPLHPIGYLTTYSSAMQILWFGFFIGWLCNTLVLRYGGVRHFKEVRGLFFGLIVGDMVMAVIWLVVGFFASISYHVLPL
ncbi:DUF6785 family protein [Desulforhabdus amnigena]|uniref:Uncharacterized protein n=1 Tax=Desulforhabdus amnigena TaxID=40218 RepID=A0A9W6D333_9BACT|nr:DUF6785 family protein [Desulforhabdus amnigena]NLJ29042.1 hypothetical protein [Deltaproteobacteria bacterium]GLI33698.1 hypothetical protein DAMNIGENAA_11310 [Desulforhabdus amnigena]